jgi:hypothetical protein
LNQSRVGLPLPVGAADGKVLGSELPLEYLLTHPRYSAAVIAAPLASVGSHVVPVVAPYLRGYLSPTKVIGVSDWVLKLSGAGTGPFGVVSEPLCVAS